MFRNAIVRIPGANFVHGLSTVDFGKPDLPKVMAQHEAYCDALEQCGLRLTRLEVDRDHPDSTFVEDTAVLTEKAAILTRPGAPSRRGEVGNIRQIVERFYSKLYQIEAPGTLDGGDVCEAGSDFLIGISHRTNEEGARQLRHFLATEGYTAATIDIRTMNSILHLKSGITYLDRGHLVIMEELAERKEFAGYSLIRVSADETYACNCVLVNDRVLIPASFPRLAARLADLGYHPMRLDMSEFRKMDGGLSCLSLRF